MVSGGAYVLSALALVTVGISIGFSAYRLRHRLLPEWEGAPARLVESIIALALLVWLGELLGTAQIFYAWTLVGAAVLVAALAMALLPGGGAAGGTAAEEASATAGGGGSPAATGPAGPETWALLVTWGVIALVFAHWGLTAKSALDRGIFNFDSLWYHLPSAAGMAQSHSVTDLHYVNTAFPTWLYPQNAELLHAVGIVLTGRDTLSLFVNFAFLGLAFLAAWCIGRPYGRGHLSVSATAILLGCHTLVVREPGAGKDDLVAASLLLAAVAILVNAWAGRRRDQKAFLPLGWPLAFGGLAVGLAVGTKWTALAIAACLSAAAISLAPRGCRRAAAGWWLVPVLLGGGYWYLRDLIVAGNPMPAITHIGPIALPHPAGLQTLRPDFSIAHYATDTNVWREYFIPGLHEQFGALWPLVVGGGLLAAVAALIYGRDRLLRWMGGTAVVGLIVYVFMPLSAGGAEGAPVAFAINVRYAVPALLMALALLPLARLFDGSRSQTMLLTALILILVVTDRSDAVLRDPDRTFAIPLALLVVLVPAGLLLARRRGLGLPFVLAGFGALVLAVGAIGYPLQRDYLRDRFGPGSEIPGMDMEAAYRWARGKSDARIGIVGTTAGFLQYGLYGTDLSNSVVYLGEKGPHGAFNAIPTCARFRAALNAADVEYLVTAPFLNFIHTDEPIPSPESHWLRGAPAARPILRSGSVKLWKLNGRLDPSACGPANAPLRRIPDTPGTLSQ